jgi:hypothetical protein
VPGGNFLRGAGGKFAGSKGGHVGGGKVVGGSRGVVARARLRQALTKLREAKRTAEPASSGRVGSFAAKLLARRERIAALHKREVARIEKRGALDLKTRGTRGFAAKFGFKPSKSDRIGFRHDRVHYAREKIRALREKIRSDAFVQRSKLKSPNPAEAGIARRDRGSYAKALLAARRALRNRKRELARIQ